MLYNDYRIYGYKHTLSKPGLGHGSGPGYRHSSFYFYVTLTVTDTGFGTLTVTQINQQKADINPPRINLKILFYEYI
jgi:hypothetical protein